MRPRHRFLTVIETFRKIAGRAGQGPAPAPYQAPPRTTKDRRHGNAFLGILVALALSAPALGGSSPARAETPDPLVAQATAERAYVFAEFVSKTCPVCDEMAPVVREVLGRYPDVRHQVHDADTEVALSKKYKVRCVPVYVVVDPEGSVRFNDVGLFTADELDAILREAGAAPR